MQTVSDEIAIKLTRTEKIRSDFVVRYDEISSV